MLAVGPKAHNIAAFLPGMSEADTLHDPPLCVSVLVGVGVPEVPPLHGHENHGDL